MMLEIHDFMDLPDNIQLRELGTQEYEADVVILEREGEIAAAAVFTGDESECVCP